MKTIPHCRLFVGESEARAAAAVVRSRQLAQGPQVGLLEQELGEYCGHRHGVAVSSGTAALYCALRSLGVGRGHAVVIPAYVCTALLNAVTATGARPVLADVDPDTGNMGPGEAKAVMRRNVKAVIVPHLFGFPAPAGEIERETGVPVIEDCAQCVGAAIGGAPVGSLTAISVFSFYATKMLAAGEGGMIATSSTALARAAADIRDYDKRDNYRERFNFKLSDIHAAIAREQVRKIDVMVRRRRAIAAAYYSGLEDCGRKVRLPVKIESVEPVFYRFVVRIGNGAGRVVAAMHAASVGCARPVFKPLYRYLGEKSLPGTETMFRTAVSLPLYPDLTAEEIRRVVRAFRRVCQSAARKE
jgi:dTDP-4-amino-4,6-dideoxygalactose transaminase